MHLFRYRIIKINKTNINFPKAGMTESMTRHYAANEACDFFELFEIAFSLLFLDNTFVFKKKSSRKASILIK